MAKPKKKEPVKVRLRQNDLVEVTTGREKGKTGKILKVFTEKNQVLVEKVNLIKRHSRPSPTTGQGGIIEKEAPLNVAKVKLVCPKCAAPTRFSMARTGEGKKVRKCLKCKELIDG